MPKYIWDAAFVVACLGRYFDIGELAAREYLTTLDDADATLLWNCLRRLGWWFPDDQQSAQERLVWWLFRDDVTRFYFSDGTERRRIETPEDRLREANEEVPRIARMVTIQADSCLSVANYVRGALRLVENNQSLLGHPGRKFGWPEHGGLGFAHIRFDGDCLNDALNAAAKQLGLPPGQLHWQEATGHWFTTERREFDDVRRLLTDWRDVLGREIQERGELPPGWEATDTTWPDCPIKTVEDLRPWLSSWLSDIHRARSSSWGSPELYLDDVQRELRNTRRAMRAWGVSLPSQFDDNPANIIEAEKQLEWLIDLLGTTTSETPTPIAASTATMPDVSVSLQPVQEVAPPAVEKVEPPRRVLKEPKPEAIAAYRLSMLGWKQQPIADQLTKEFKQPFPQWKVSRLLTVAKDWLEAGNVFPPLSEVKPATTVDPAEIDKGARQDHQTPRQRHRQTTDE